jgi:peptidyl-tRNA hydrolase
VRTDTAAFQVTVSCLFVVLDKFPLIIGKIRLEFMRRGNSGSNGLAFQDKLGFSGFDKG